MVKREIDHSVRKEELKSDFQELQSKKNYAKSLMTSVTEEEEDENEEEEEEEEMDKLEDEETEENDVDTDEIEALENDSEEDDGLEDEKDEEEEEEEAEADEEKNKRFVRIRRSVNKYPRASAGQSPLSVNYANNYDAVQQKSWVKPMFSSIVYNLPVRTHN